MSKLRKTVLVYPIYHWHKKAVEFAGLMEDVTVISTVSKQTGFYDQLSPFILGPCELYHGRISLNMENAWQYAKVYKEHLTSTGILRMSYWQWAEQGWNNPRAVRYPMDRGAKPEYSLWNSKRLGYIEARKRIYGPLYAEAVQKTDAWQRLQDAYCDNRTIVLLDYDAYDHSSVGMSLTDVLNNPKRKMGHAFVLAMLLQNDPALKQMRLR